jgi:ATP-dependent Lhr-like helicase
MVSDYMDIESLKSLLRMLDSSDTEIIMNEDLSESSRSFLTHYLERVMPIKPTKVILEAVKNRLMNESMMLICTKCRNIRTGKINSFESLRCNVCGSTLVAAFSEYERDRISDAIMNGNDKNTERRIIKNAHLIKEKGMTALITLAARGVGTETANRLLETSYSSEEDLLKAILNAEMEYSRNRRYWD